MPVSMRLSRISQAECFRCQKARREILHEDEASAIIIARLALALEKSKRTIEEKRLHIEALRASRRWL